MTIVFTPLSRAQLAALVEGSLPGPVLSFAATPTLLETFSLTPADDEESERTALLLAGLAALVANGTRMVVVTESSASDTRGAFGEVTLPGLAWADVTAVFVDDPASGSAVAEVAASVAGLDLDTAWDLDPVQRLMSEHDLLWYGPEEIGTLVGA